MKRVTEIHLTPNSYDPDDADHFTRCCWCAPICTEIALGLFRYEVIYFHRELSLVDDQESDSDA